MEQHKEVQNVNRVYLHQTPDGYLEYYQNGYIVESNDEEETSTCKFYQEWYDKITSFTKLLGREPSNPLKKKGINVKGYGHQDVFYTQWGSNPPEGAIVTFDFPGYNKAWVF